MSLRFAIHRSTAVFALLAATASLLVFAQQGATPPEVPPAPGASAGPKFPPVDARNFTAASPSRETVEAFLHVSWGYDTDRVWQVQAIQKTPGSGVSKVTALVAQ